MDEMEFTEEGDYEDEEERSVTRSRALARIAPAAAGNSIQSGLARISLSSLPTRPMAAAARPLALLASASKALGASSRLAVSPSRLPRAVAFALRGRRSFAAAAGGVVMGKAGAVDADAGMNAHQRRLLFEDE
ncbi:hypothetical protein PR202_ga04672 [Eleusine coracana subsp. coracana]|uniref:Uncharacterized protein n=1 Tax=Eleusine coracana subsp. coracana TaxID=191504 RepID=A0AAV5BS62_ELECO|nr:hypothetical protein PR202_ga04672 [Eleusine coracana subsp. coracana]